MSIQPIDLQALYSQIDKVAKVHSQQTQGQQIKDAIQQDSDAKKLLQKKSTVAGTQKLSDGLSGVKERKNSQQDGTDSHSDGSDQTEEEKDLSNDKPFFADPNLGQNIDVSG
ncbi:MAG: hypothetical protein ACRC4W_09300 [Treponemataceae bacterium]